MKTDQCEIPKTSMLSVIVFRNCKGYWNKSFFGGCHHKNSLVLLMIIFMVCSCQATTLSQQTEKATSTILQENNEDLAIPLVREKPPSRAFHQMIYDNTRKLIVMFGGQSGSFSTTEDEMLPANFLNDTWEFNGDAWQQVITPINPDLAEGYGMTFDVNRSVTVLIGGRQESGTGNRFAKTWEFDGSDWKLLTPTNELPAQSFPLLAFHPHQKDIFLFSGFQLSDIWRYDGQSWTLFPSQVPPLMRGSPIAKVVYFEQTDAFIFTNLEGETQIFAPFREDKWRLLPSRNESNRGRFGFDMVYDANRGVIVLFGGQKEIHSEEDTQAEITEALNDTWEFNGEVWYKVSPLQAPPVRYGHAMAYDEARGVTENAGQQRSDEQAEDRVAVAVFRDDTGGIGADPEEGDGCQRHVTRGS